MSIYTYIVEHENDDHIRVNCDTKINGGKLLGIGHFDALQLLEEMEDRVNETTAKAELEEK